MISSSTPERIPRSPVRRAWVLVVVGIFTGVVVILSGCSGTPGSGPLRLTVSGRAVVEDPAGEQIVVEGSRRLELGSLVEMVSGQATLEYPDGTTLELRAGVGRADDTTLLAASTPDLRGGDVLVVDSPDATIEADGTAVHISGTGKVGRRLSLVTQIFAGEAMVTSGGRSVSVPALRQASVPAARLVPASPSPVAYDPADPWDRRYLGDAIAMGDELLSRARGFTAQLGPGEGSTPGFYRLLLPDLDTQPGFDGSLLDRSRPPGETLVGAAIAVVAAGDDVGEFEERWASVFAFREEGAHWGLVALDHGVDRDPLVDRLDAAIARAPLSEVAVGTPGGRGASPLVPPFGSPSPGGEPAAPPPDDGGGGDGGGGDDDGGGGGDDPVPPDPDVVTDLLDGLLDDASDDPSQSSDDTTDDSGGLLGGLLADGGSTLEAAAGLLGG
jgi:hypothetical protein